MKKIIPVFLIILCITGGVIFYKVKSTTPVENPAHFLPEDVIFYLDHKDLGSLIDTFQETPLSQAIQSIDYIKIALDIEAPIETINTLQRIKEVVAASTTQLLLDELFSEEFAVALVPESGVIDPGKLIEKNLFVICRPKHSVALLELLSSSLSKKFNITSSQYGKYLIHRMAIEDDLTVSFVSIGSFVMMAMSERTVRERLDRYDDKSTNLNDNYSFKKLRQKYSDSQLFCFFSVENLRHHLDAIFNSDGKISGELSLMLDNWRGFNSGAYAVKQKEMMIEDIVTLSFDKDTLKKYPSRFLQIQPEKDSNIYHTPADVLFYYWTNTFDLTALWDLYVEQTKGENNNEFEENIERLFGTSITDIIDLVGSQFSVMVKEPSPVDFLPIPNFSIVVDLKDMEKAQLILERILSKNEVPHKSQSYRGVTFTYWGEGIQNGLQPVYALHGGSIYFSSSVAMLKTILDTISEGDGLVSGENFQLIASPLLLENNSIRYTKFASMLDVTKELVSWGGTMLALQNRQAAYKSKILIDGLIQPLLDGLKMYSTIATRSYINNGVLTIESKTKIAH